MAVAIFLLLAVTSCADPHAHLESECPNDPAEPLNRKIFEGNQIVDRNFIRPVAQAYKDIVPTGVKRGIGNFVGNLQEPQIGINDALQGNVGRAGNTALRFAVNTTAGVGGIFDVASGWSFPGHQADFGQTLGVWGVASGPFVELPLLGPSNVRDSLGSAVGAVTNPFGSVVGVAPLTTIGYVGGGLGLLQGRAEVLDATNSLEAKSLDYYATLRSISSQRRDRLIAEGKNPDLQATAPAEPGPNPFAPAVP